jgi:hypothetical protein
MMLWRMLWKAEALFLALLVGCSNIPHIYRVETGAGGETIIHIPRTATVEGCGRRPDHAARRT